jgi:hypothetical protein
VRLSKSTQILIVLSLVFLLVAGCNMPAKSVTPAPVEATPPVELTPVEGSIAAPAASATPAPTAAPTKVILLALNADPGRAAALQPLISEAAAAAGFSFELRSELSGPALEPEVRLAVVLPDASGADPGVQNLANSSPSVQFLAVGLPGVQPAGNVSVVGGGGVRPDQQGFLAGYLAALITNDWRVGTIGRGDTPPGRAARNGFTKGAVFYCGLCRPAVPPFLQYPLFSDLAAGASPADQQAAIAAMASNAVKTIYLAPEAGDGAIFEAIQQSGLKVIGAVPPPAALAELWVASIRPDEGQAVKSAVERLLKGESAISVEIPLAITDRNPALFSVGRQRLVDELLAELLAGFVDTGINLETGEPK